MSFRLDILIPFFIGAFSVAQAGLNRRIAGEWGLSWAVLFNTLVLLLIVLACLGLGYWAGKFSFSSIKWWYLIPGIAGFIIVAGLPLSVARVGAMSTFMFLIAGQMIFSALWDKGFEGIPVSLPRVVGAVLVMAGAWIASK